MFDRTHSGALGPHFAQLKHIGGGGSGSVYSGVDTRYGFPVCIKRLAVKNKEECQTTLREIRILRRLRHENIVCLLNAITSEGTDVSDVSPTGFRDTSCIYLVQELFDADLRQVIEGNGHLSDDYVKLFFYQLLRGLKYIHSANVFHRDLKPSNVLVNVSSLELRIGDFGNAVVLDPEYNHLSSLGSCDTSLWYKAPELIVRSSDSYSIASDMWSAGCILAEMLLSRPLFEGENELEQLELIIHTIDVEKLDEMNVRRCLTKEVNEMYSGQPKFPLYSKFQKIDFHAQHLLERLLSFNPSERVSTECALSHPYFGSYSCVADEPSCLKPLHLEHEVDDFLEYTLKDLIVGECVALADEQPRIHMQMSSYSSLMDIVKELNVSPPASQSLEEGKNVAKVAAGGVLDEKDNGDGRCFKVLEVLKEEHTSSSESNGGIHSHEDGISDEPLVSDHPTFSSLKWENERHKFGHRRHHGHHRKKTAGDDGSRSRKRKMSPASKPYKNPNAEREANAEGLSLEGLLPGGHGSGNLSSPNEPMTSPGKLPVREGDSPLSPKPLTEENRQDDKVHELILESRILIGEQQVHEATETREQHARDGAETTEAGDSAMVTGGGTSDERGSAWEKVGLSGSDSSVADVIRRSRDILAEVCSNVAREGREEKLDDNHRGESVKDLIVNAGQSPRSCKLVEHVGTEVSGVPLDHRREETRDLGPAYDSCLNCVENLILKSEQLLHHRTENVVASCGGERKPSPEHFRDSVEDLILKSQQLLSCTNEDKEDAEGHGGIDVNALELGRENILPDGSREDKVSGKDLSKPREQLIPRSRLSLDSRKAEACSKNGDGRLYEMNARDENSEISTASEMTVAGKQNSHDPVKELVLKSQQLLNSIEHETTSEREEKQFHDAFPKKDDNFLPTFLELTAHNSEPREPTLHCAMSDKTEDETTDAGDNRRRGLPTRPTCSTNSMGQPMLPDPYHIQENSRRMEELFQESHTLQRSLRRDPERGSSSEMAFLEPNQPAVSHSPRMPRDVKDHDAVRAVRDDLECLDDRKEMRVVLEKATQLLNQDGGALPENIPRVSESSQGLRTEKDTADPNTGETPDSVVLNSDGGVDNEKNNVLDNLQPTTNPDVVDIATVEMCRGGNPCCRLSNVSQQVEPTDVNEQPTFLELALVEDTAELLSPVLMTNCVARARQSQCPGHNSTKDQRKSPETTGEPGRTGDLHHCDDAADQGRCSHTNGGGVQVFASGSEKTISSRRHFRSCRQSDQDVVRDKDGGQKRLNSSAVSPTNSSVVDEVNKREFPFGNGGSLSQETPAIWERNNEKKNDPRTNTTSLEVVAKRKVNKEDEKNEGRDDRDTTKVDTNTVYQHNASSNEPPSRQKGRFVGAETGGEDYSTHNGLKFPYETQSLVGRFYRGAHGVAEIHTRNSSGYHSKDNASLRNFYRSIKIKSLMNRSRTYRDKLY